MFSGANPTSTIALRKHNQLLGASQFASAKRYLTVCTHTADKGGMAPGQLRPQAIRIRQQRSRHVVTDSQEMKLAPLRPGELPEQLLQALLKRYPCDLFGRQFVRQHGIAVAGVRIEQTLDHRITQHRDHFLQKRIIRIAR